LFGGDIAFCR